MRTDPNSGYSYQVGGSLAVNHFTYVERQADKDFYNGLKNGEYCYVLNSRQMGKSSLRVRTMYQLQVEGIACAEIDLSGIETNITAQAWYGAIVYKLIIGFNLKIDRRTWKREHDYLSPMQYFNEFIERILLTEFSQHIVIFIDEIDTLLKLDFGDDFLAFIRACYNRRADSPEYRRLTFSLIGSTSPSNLIKDKERTPFNIGKDISLEGFHEDEVEPLKRGLYERFFHPEPVMKEILYWTGGQPFLTQKLCKLILTAGSSPLIGSEREWVENLVRSQVIEKWESQDEPQHLKTIRDRLLSNKQRAPRLLGLYQQIWPQGEVEADDSLEHIELRLSGLVVQKKEKLRVYNRIYECVFNQNWVDKELAKLLPLFILEPLNRWEDSGRKEKSWLLRGQALRDAKKWAEGRNLTDSDPARMFIKASEELEKEEEQRRREEEQRKKYIKRLYTAVKVIVSLLLVSIMLVVYIYLQSNNIQKANQDILARSLLERAELITQPDLLPIRVELGIEAINKSNSVEVKPFLYDDLALLRRFKSLDNRGSINTIAFSKHGKYLATAGLDNGISGDRYVCVFENQEFNFSDECVSNNNKIGNVNAITFSPDEKYLATASVDGKAYVWDISSRKEIFCHADDVSANAVSFSPDGEYLVTAWANGKVLVFKRKGCKLINSMSHQKSVVAMTFSENGQYLATASLDGTAYVWNDWKRQNNDKEPVKLSHEGPVTDVSFSPPDDKFLATVSSDNNAYVWNTISGKKVQTMKHDNDVLAVTFSHDGKHLATASLDKTARVWDVNSGKELVKLKHGEAVTNVIFSLDDKYLGTASRDKTARIWEIPSGDEFARLIHKDEVNAIAFSPDTKYLATASLDGTTLVWDIKSDRSNKTVTLIRHREKIDAMAFSEKNHYLATVSKDNATASKDNNNTVRVWSTFNGDETKYVLPQKEVKGLVTNVALSPNAQYLATVSLDGSAQLWQITPKLKKVGRKGILDHQYLTAVVFSPNGKDLVTVSKNGEAYLLNISNIIGNKKQNLQPVPNVALVETVAFSSDGKYLATGSRNGKVQVSNMSSLNKEVSNPEEKPVELQKVGQPVTVVAFSPDGKYLAAVSSDDTASIWEVTKPEKRVVTKKHDGIVTDVSFSRDGKYLATATRNDNLATPSQVNTVSVWETAKDEMPVKTILFKEPVTNVAFSLYEKDEERLAITSGETNSNKTTRILIWQGEQLMKKYPCDYLTRNLTKKEWHKYFADNEKYHKKCK